LAGEGLRGGEFAGFGDYLTAEEGVFGEAGEGLTLPGGEVGDVLEFGGVYFDGGGGVDKGEVGVGAGADEAFAGGEAHDAGGVFAERFD